MDTVLFSETALCPFSGWSLLTAQIPAYLAQPSVWRKPDIWGNFALLTQQYPQTPSHLLQDVASGDEGRDLKLLSQESSRNGHCLLKGTLVDLSPVCG